MRRFNMGMELRQNDPCEAIFIVDVKGFATLKFILRIAVKNPK